MAMEYHHQTNYKCYNDEMKENYYNDIFMRSYNSGGVNNSNQYDSPYQTKVQGWEQLQEPCSMAIAKPPLASNQTQLTWGVDNPSFNTWDVHSCLPTPPLEAEQPMYQQHSSNRQKPMSKWKLKQERERLTLPQHVIKKRRLDANARERKRMTNLNNAFARLKAVLPPSSLDTTFTTTTDNKSQAEMSKMETLRTAQAYILHLASMLN